MHVIIIVLSEMVWKGSAQALWRHSSKSLSLLRLVIHNLRQLHMLDDDLNSLWIGRILRYMVTKMDDS